MFIHSKSHLIRPPMGFVSIVIGIFYALLIMSPEFVFAKSDYWLYPFGDRITNMIGSIYFFNQGWHFPILSVHDMAIPEGGNIVYTDSIPIIAIITKIIFSCWSGWHNLYGIWIFLCFPILAYAIHKCSRLICPDRVVVSVAAITIGLCSPALLVRYGHSALMAHFIIVLSAYLYLKSVRGGDRNAELFGFILLAILSVLVQAYFLVMVLPFFTAGSIARLSQGSLGYGRFLANHIILAFSIIITAYIAGVIGGGSGISGADGFGFYSMNLLSPFVPPKEHLGEVLTRYFKWDYLGYGPDATGGQYEGYNYLGLGLIFLISANIALARKTIICSIRKHIYLFLVLIGFICIALSTKVYLGDALIINVSFLDNLLRPLIKVFRTSGRDFWPVYYVLTIYFTALSMRTFPNNVGTLVLIIAMALQIIDTSTMRDGMRKSLVTKYPQMIDGERWRSLIQYHDSVWQYPSFQCGGLFNSKWPESNANMEILLLTAELNTPTNSAYLARQFRDCSREFTEGSKLLFDERGLYIYSGRVYENLIKSKGYLGSYCRAFDYGVLCTKRMGDIPDIIDGIARKEVLDSSYPSYQYGRLMQFSGGSLDERMLGSGWYQSEHWGTWSMGGSSIINFKAPAHTGSNLVLSITGTAFLFPSDPVTKVFVYVNSRKVTEWIYTIGDNSNSRIAILPSNIVDPDGSISIELKYSIFGSPYSAGVSQDLRDISFGISSLVLYSVQDTF